jgi:HAMP domain-containing protein
MAKTRRLWSWRTKLVVLLSFFSIAPLLGLAYWTYTTVGDTLRSSAIDSIEALARAKSEAVDAFTDDRVRDVERIATLMAPAVRQMREVTVRERENKPPEPVPDEIPPEELPDVEAIESGANKPRPDDAVQGPAKRTSEAEAREQRERAEQRARERSVALEQARRTLKESLGLLLWDQHKFEELLVFDIEGTVVASTFSGHEGKSASSLEYFQNGRKATYVQPVFLSPITEKLTMMIATPIKDEQHQEIGVLAARLNLSRFFRLINDSAGLGKSGETVVAKKIGEELVFMAPTRHDDSAALQRRIAVGDPHSSALQEAARGQDGSGEQVDYRGVNTLAAWRHVPSLGWGLLVKMDDREALEVAHEIREATIVLVLIIVVLALLAAMFAARALVQPLRHLKEATDKISRGDFDVQLDIHSRDEVGELADSFERMVAAIKFFREHSRPEADEDPDDLADGDTAARG